MALMGILLMNLLFCGLFWAFFGVLAAAAFGFLFCAAGCIVLAVLYRRDVRQNGGAAGKWKRTLAILLGTLAALMVLGAGALWLWLR